MAIKVPVDNLYANGFSIDLTQGRKLLKRNKIKYTPSAINDRSHRLVEGDTLWSLADRFYQNSKLYHIIADVNNIENPLDITALVGTELIIPDEDLIKAGKE